MAKELLPDELWQEIEPLLPPPPPPSPKGGRPPMDHRKALAGIVFVNRHGHPLAGPARRGLWRQRLLLLDFGELSRAAPLRRVDQGRHPAPVAPAAAGPLG